MLVVERVRTHLREAMRASEEDANRLRQESAEGASQTVENVEKSVRDVGMPR
jgi:hypothetical protein